MSLDLAPRHTSARVTQPDDLRFALSRQLSLEVDRTHRAIEVLRCAVLGERAKWEVVVGVVDLTGHQNANGEQNGAQAPRQSHASEADGRCAVGGGGHPVTVPDEVALAEVFTATLPRYTESQSCVPIGGVMRSLRPPCIQESWLRLC